MPSDRSERSRGWSLRVFFSKELIYVSIPDAPLDEEAQPIKTNKKSFPSLLSHFSPICHPYLISFLSHLTFVFLSPSLIFFFSFLSPFPLYLSLAISLNILLPPLSLKTLFSIPSLLSAIPPLFNLLLSQSLSLALYTFHIFLYFFATFLPSTGGVETRCF